MKTPHIDYHNFESSQTSYESSSTKSISSLLSTKYVTVRNIISEEYLVYSQEPQSTPMKNLNQSGS